VGSTSEKPLSQLDTCPQLTGLKDERISERDWISRIEDCCWE
jgi:hypothetical protein